MELVEFIDTEAEVTLVGQVIGNQVYLDRVYDDQTGEYMRLSGEEHYMYEHSLREAFNNGLTNNGDNDCRGNENV